ncbi:MAG TPA: nucleic acid-binding protein [Ruminococcaceae bacterium]|nr:nucleic acid-binding protein [Oscillospiraceae bacterium]
MILDLRPIFTSETAVMPLDYALSFSDFEFSGTCPVIFPVRVQGEIRREAELTVLSADIIYDYSAPCDRCASPIVKEITESVYHVLADRPDGGEETEETVLLDDMRLDLDEMVRTDLILSLPTKFVCSEDCRGLCPLCGKNLNEGECGCNNGAKDIRLEKLKELLDR